MIPHRSIPIQGERTPLLRLPAPGLSGVLSIRETSRIKSFGLGEALQYSYMRDTRFVVLTSLLLFFGLWSMLSPAPLCLKPAALISPDMGFLLKVAKNIYIEGICSNHPQVISPCDCGEPLNSILEHLLDTPKESEDSPRLIWGRQSIKSTSKPVAIGSRKESLSGH